MVLCVGHVACETIHERAEDAPLFIPLPEKMKDVKGGDINKKHLEQKTRRYLFKDADIWSCSIGQNIREELCGKGRFSLRPVLVLKKLSETAFVGIPFTTKLKVGSWYVDVRINGEMNTAILSQVRMFSASRFLYRKATLNDADFVRVKEKLESLLELSDYHRNTCSGSVGTPKVIGG